MSPRTENKIFLDDTMFLTIGKSFKETHHILKDMMEHGGGGYDWAKAQNSCFDTSKFALIDFHTKEKCKRSSMTLRGITLTPAKHHKFLRVIMDQILRWNVQVSHTITKGTAYAIQLKWLLTTYNGIPLSLMYQLYLAVALPKMLYAVDVYRPTYLYGYRG